MIIYLNGPSSSGKTTLAHALQNAFKEPLLHLGIDKIIDFMPSKINNWTGGVAPLGFSWKAGQDPDGHPVYNIQSGPFAKRITRTLKDIAQLLASQGYHLIIDDVAFGAVEVEEWKPLFTKENILYVGVHVALDVLEKRERHRGDRYIGSGRGQFFKVHEDVSYDVEVDTHAQSIEENVSKIRDAFMQKYNLLIEKDPTQF